MYIMGVLDAITVDKYKAEAKVKGRDSWWLAYIMDESSYGKRRDDLQVEILCQAEGIC